MEHCLLGGVVSIHFICLESFETNRLTGGPMMNWLQSDLTATTKDFPPKTFPELLAYAKQNPGKVRYGTVGVGSYPHFDMAVFAKRAGLEMNHIPNKAGASGVINDMVSGDTQVSYVRSLICSQHTCSASRSFRSSTGQV